MSSTLPPITNTVSEQEIDDSIVNERYWQPANTAVTICLLTLDNGFQVSGFSAAVSYENFDAELGRLLARENANSKIWELLGFRLAEKMHNEETAAGQRLG